MWYKKYDVFPTECQMSEVIDRLSTIGKYVLYRYIQIPYSMQICRIMHQLKQRKIKNSDCELNNQGAPSPSY